MNLADAAREYRQVLERFSRLAAPGEQVPRDAELEAQRRLDAVRKKAMRDIDEYTARRFLPVNTRRGLTGKLERLHRQAQEELRAIAAARRRPP